MKRVFLAVVAAAFWAQGCGGAGFEEPATDGPAATVTEQKKDSLWPLDTGRTWTYRVTDEVKGVTEKRVEVLGVQTVPDTGVQAVAVKSIQPTLEELSWQTVGADGLVMRVREEDFKDGALARVTTWKPSTIKSLSTPQPAGSVVRSVVSEVIRDGAGVVTDMSDEIFVWTVISVGETVTVPAGMFEGAIKVQRDRPDRTGKLRTYWLVPGVGKVREEGERTEELTAFTKPTE